MSVKNYPGPLNKDIVEEIHNLFNETSEYVMVHACANGLAIGVNLLNKVRKILNKSKQVSPRSKIAFTNVLFVNDKQNIKKLRILRKNCVYCVKTAYIF